MWFFKKRKKLRPIETFFAESTKEFHDELKAKGHNTSKIIAIPELLPLGEKAILYYLKTPFVQMLTGNDPARYYFYMTNLAFTTGINYGNKWHEDYEELKNSYAVTAMVEGGHLEAAIDILFKTLNYNEKKKNKLFAQVSDIWSEMVEPYWNLPENEAKAYIFQALLAAYQAGVSLILIKYGY